MAGNGFRAGFARTNCAMSLSEDESVMKRRDQLSKMIMQHYAPSLLPMNRSATTQNFS